MIQSPHSIPLQSAEETAQFAVQLGALLELGDCLLLVGSIGAGKTHFARNLIQSLLDVIEDVPSPTFTLVQTYDTKLGQLWHADLYRLTALDEIEELGLSDAFDTAICLIEWPDRLGVIAPPDALTITLELDQGSEFKRNMSFTWTNPRWSQVLGQIFDD